MTVTSSTSSVSYAGNGATTAFAVPYYFLEETHLLVTLLSAAGVETTQVLTTNYTVIGAGVLSGGTVTMLVAPPSGSSLFIRRNVPATQLVDYVANDAFPAETHEQALDKLTMLAQESDYLLGRAMILRETDVDGSGAFAGRSNRITDLDDPTQPSDAVTLSYMQAYVQSVGAGGSGVTPTEYEFTGDGVLTTFSVPGITSGFTSAYLVTLNGLVQNPTQDYVIDDTADTITFTTPPPNGIAIGVRVLGYQALILPSDAQPGAHTFWRGDATYANTLVAASGGVSPPADTNAGFNLLSSLSQTAIRVGADGQADLHFAQYGSANPYEMRFGWVDSLSALTVAAYAGATQHLFYENGNVQLGQFASLFVDRANIRVGIGGNTSPTEALDVTGNIACSGSFLGNIPASSITSGIINPARLGAGTADNTVFLRGDGVWATGGGGGGWSDEQSQDAIGAILTATATITPTYSDATPSLTWDVVAGSIGATQLATNAVTTVKILDANVTVAKISATGTPSSTTFLRGDGQWQSPSVTLTGNVTDSLVFVNSSEANREELRFVVNGSGTLRNWTLELYDGSGWNEMLEFVGDSGSPGVTTLACSATDVTFQDGAIRAASLQNLGSAFVLGATGAGVTQRLTPTQLTTIINNVVGDSGAGGTKGLVPAPAAGDAAANRFLKADGTWSTVSATAGVSTASDTATIDHTVSVGNLTSTIVAGSVGTTQLSNLGVTTAKIADANVTGAKIASATIQGSNIASATIAGTNLINGTISDVQLAAASVTAAKIAANAVDYNKINATGLGALRYLRVNATSNGLEWVTPAGSSTSPYYNVRDYGAVGNGITDDRTAIITAAAAAQGAGGGVVFFPAGVYAVSAPITFTSYTKVAFVGSSNGASVLKSTATVLSVNETIFRFSGGSKIEIRNLTFDNNSKFLTGDGGIVQAISTTDIGVYDCRFENCTKYGIVFQLTVRWAVERCYFHKVLPVRGDIQNAGIIITDVGPSGPGRFCFNEVYNFGCMFGGDDVLIDCNYFKDNGYGAAIFNNNTSSWTNRHIITRNICSGGVGIDFNNTPPSGLEVYAPYSYIAGNICFNNVGAGVSNGGHYSVVDGNVCYDNDIGIFMHWINSSPNNGGRCIYSNNVVHSNTSFGVYQLDPPFGGAYTDTRLIGNKVYQNGQDYHWGLSAIRQQLEGDVWNKSTTWDPASINAGLSTSTTIAVPGAVVGDMVAVSFSVSLGGLVLSAYVSAVDTVTVVLSNPTAGAVNLGSGTLKVRVLQEIFYQP